MARKADGRGKIRAELEDVTLCMDAIDGSVALVRLRVEQAIRRAGLDGLLVPALEELVCIDAAGSTVRAHQVAGVIVHARLCLCGQ